MDNAALDTTATCETDGITQNRGPWHGMLDRLNGFCRRSFVTTEISKDMS